MIEGTSNKLNPEDGETPHSCNSPSSCTRPSRCRTTSLLVSVTYLGQMVALFWLAPRDSKGWTATKIEA